MDSDVLTDPISAQPTQIDNVDNLSGEVRLKRKKLPRKWRVNFLRNYANVGIVRAAAQAAGISLSTVYAERDRNPKFRDAMEVAFEESNQLLQMHIWQRATVGKSDRMLEFEAKRRMPSYRDKFSAELSGPDGRPLPAATIQTQQVIFQIPPNFRNDSAHKTIDISPDTPQDPR